MSICHIFILKNRFPIKLNMANYKRIFLEGYSYYITVVTHHRNPILIDNIDLLRESFRVSKRKYRYTLDEIVILPDHFHMIISPETASEYPKIIRAIKYHFSTHLESKFYAHLTQSSSRCRRGSKAVWQKRYYEHTIRDEKDYREKCQYMFNNPVKHDYVECVEDWIYSSFRRHKH